MDLHTLHRSICLFGLVVQIVWTLDQVTLLNPPEEPVPDHLLDVLYSCNGPAAVQLDCVVSFETGITSTTLLRRWSCVPGHLKVKTLALNLPDWLVYRADGIVPDSRRVLSCVLLASVRYGGFDDTEESLAAQDAATLQPKGFFGRPMKRHQLCVPWSTEMLRITQLFSKKQCPMERETVHLLSSMYGSIGETFGITKTLEPYGAEVLEYLRVEAISSPWCMFSVWIFVTRHCQDDLCGLLYHVDSHNNYVTPTLFLKKSGQLHVQMDGESHGSSAFAPAFKVPLSEWCQISVALRDTMVTVSMVCLNKEQRTVYSIVHMLAHIAVLDDTEGYFGIGGGKYIRGVAGFFGPVIYYRNRIPPHSMAEVVVPDVIRTLNLTGWLESCQEFRLEMDVKISGYLLEAQQETESETCFDGFHERMVKCRQPSEQQCELWETTVPRRRQAAKLARFLVFKHGKRRASLPAVGRALYSLSLHKLSRASNAGAVSRILPLLLQAGCLADNQALHMSSVLYTAGLGVEEQPNKAWLLALLAAQKDQRLALLRLGHLHHLGVDGLPTDPDLAYAYYANIAQQTTLDRHNPVPEQIYVEAVYLNDDEALNLQTNEDHHLFQWLTLQARRGAAEAEGAVARMLFWGQQGVSPDIQKAVRHYERGAVQWKDPASMYDYGIVLLQGLGVEKDIPKALTFLKKAMDQDFVPAINALAWYYEQFEHDYMRAVRLWQQADLLQSPDAAFNLGVVYSQGLYPGKAADRVSPEYERFVRSSTSVLTHEEADVWRFILLSSLQCMAYRYYLKSAERGHIRGAIHLASIWTTGLPGCVHRRPSDALLWVKWAAEHNGYLGSVLRKALDLYLKGDMFSSLLYYMVAAESGYSPAQFNAAYLCEQNTLHFLDTSFASNCMWRYYNLTLQSQNPDTYALIRMGDLLYEGRSDRQKELFSAAAMYTRAAVRNNPQGWYNLGLLAEEGYRLPLSVLIDLGLSELYLADNSLLLSTLYKRCRDSEDTDSYLPCSLALFNVDLQLFKRDYGAAIKFSTAVGVVAAPTIVLIIIGVLRRHFRSPN